MNVFAEDRHATIPNRPSARHRKPIQMWSLRLCWRWLSAFSSSAWSASRISAPSITPRTMSATPTRFPATDHDAGFRSIVFSAVLAGLIVGVVISVAQFFGTVPLIQQSEVYERKAAAKSAGALMHTPPPPMIKTRPLFTRVNGSPRKAFSATPYGRGQYPDSDRFCPVAWRSLCGPRPCR